jgi:hypothetical protein
MSRLPSPSWQARLVRILVFDGGPVRLLHLYTRMANLISSVFTRSCSHEFSWPRRRADGSHYQTCVQCGDNFFYDWDSMTRGERFAAELDESHLDKPHKESTPEGRRTLPRARRLATATPIMYRQTRTSEWHSGTLENISASGVRFSGNQLLPDDADVEMIFEMPEQISGQPSSRVLCHGYVARSGCSRQSPTLAVAICGYTFLHEN